jgi:hypothetical protein
MFLSVRSPKTLVAMCFGVSTVEELLTMEALQVLEQPVVVAVQQICVVERVLQID